MKPCPICGKKIDKDSVGYGVHYNEILGKWMFDHWCDDENPTACWLSVSAPTKEEVIERWNRRAEVEKG